MPARQTDKIVVTSSGGVFDRFSSLIVTNDITSPSEAVFELGDDTAWNSLEAIIRPGEPFEVKLNGRPRMVGRAEVNESPVSDGGTTVNLTVRTKMSDAAYRSADANVRIKDRSIKDAIVEAYSALGYVESDFVFAPFAARDLMTGKSPGSSADVLNLEPIQTDQAKVQVPETIRDFVERHLKRYHATHWDAPDGRIVVGVPDDTQAPLYRFVQRRPPNGQQNNILACRAVRDWTDVARTVKVFGHTVGRDVTSSSISSEALDADVDEVAARTGHFNRLAYVSANQAKTAEHADSIAARELSARVRRKNAWEIEVDGWSYWDGTKQIPYANDTTADLDIERATRMRGRYLVVRVVLTYSETVGRRAQLTLVAPGIWVV